MKIETSRPETMVFAKVPDGHVFIEDGDYCIKSGNRQNVNAVRLSDGAAITYGPLVEVTYCPNARLVID